MSRIQIPSLGSTAGYTDARLVDAGLAIAVIVFTKPFHRIPDTAVDFPPV
jgi:hypothetical protein